MNPFEQVEEAASQAQIVDPATIQQTFNPIGAIGRNAVNSGVAQTTSIVSGISNVQKNFGVFAVGALLVVAGILFITFAWGERLATVAENVVSKLPVVVPV